MKDKNKYEIKVSCENCGYGPIPRGEVISVEKGKSLEEIPCPYCGCKKLLHIW